MARYGYFWGCYVQGRMPHIEKSTRAVMACLGIECADLDGLTCCPEKTMIANLDHRAWLTTAARNLTVAEDAGVDFITPCPGCFGTLKGAAAELDGNPARRDEVNRQLQRVGRRYRAQARVSHFLEILHRDIGLAGLRARVTHPLDGTRIAVHYGCHLLKPSADLAFDDPDRPRKFDELVEALGAISLPYETKFSCCGGLLSRVEDEETGRAMARLKLRELTELGADAICLACPSCMMQYDMTQFLLQRRGEALQVPVLYYSELLGLALGLEAEELGLSAHRTDVAPFLEQWRARQRAIEGVKRHWDYGLLRKCAECGACMSDCQVARADPGFDPNRIIRELAAGHVEQVLRDGEFWRCVECYTCREECFQGYSMLDILRVAKHLSLAQGRAPAGTAEGVAAFRRQARLIEAGAASRKRLGLPPVRESGGDELAHVLGGGAQPPPPQEDSK
ncbi:MAG TPA: heterodisulfide reductase-related iron-sulfur binding cluster [Armatimonadota bacterium]|nr:heterodisulfide reductase-related iron-sulfur binding cluster [Armatimonadota bacterium]